MKCTNFEPVRISGPYCTQCSPVPEKHICYMTIYFTFETHFSWRPIATATRIVFTDVSSHTRDHFAYFRTSNAVLMVLFSHQRNLFRQRGVLPHRQNTLSHHIYTLILHGVLSHRRNILFYGTASSRTGQTLFFAWHPLTPAKRKSTARRPLAPAKMDSST